MHVGTGFPIGDLHQLRCEVDEPTAVGFEHELVPVASGDRDVLVLDAVVDPAIARASEPRSNVRQHRFELIA